MRIRLFLLLSLSLAAWAQTRDTASISGVVNDAQSAAIPAATVTLTSVATGRVRWWRCAF